MATETEDDTRAIPGPLRDDLLVVGLGASAGGIGALKAFFEAAGPDGGIAFVVILHLSPEHESNLAEVLSASTPLTVSVVRDRARLEPDHVYVVSPNRKLELVDGSIASSALQTTEERRAPIDMFFRALAETHRASAVAVVLSGSGADGSVGLKRVKELGGLCIAQDPGEAEFADMPRNAIATGLVDYVLPVAQLPARIAAYRRHIGSLDVPAPGDGGPEVEQALVEIFTQMRVRTGHDFSNYKRSTLMRRIERRMNVHEVVRLNDYARFLRENREEAFALLADLLISVTNFFRDPEAFAALQAKVVPRLFQGKGPDDHVRVWVPGCATGEEAYSIAMLLAEYAQENFNGPAIQVVATDSDERALATARAGLYTATDTADVSPERLRRFFVKDGDGFRVQRELRETVLFASHNVLKDPPFSHLDLVSCRNLLIYLNRTAQERILKLFHFGLDAGGFLFLGTSESADDIANLFTAVDKEHHLFQSRGVDTPLAMPPVSASPLPVARAPEGEPASADRAEARVRDRLSYQELHQRLLEQYAPPSVVVNREYDILHLSERAGRYLQFVGGEPSQNLLKVVRPELRLELHSALYQAVQQKIRVRVSAGPLTVEGREEAVGIVVSPVMSEFDVSRGLILVTFESTEAAAGEVAPARAEEAASEPLAHRLDEELVRVKLQLRTTIEQHELQQEELKASNEELQSVNEELTTVNQELKTKIDELSQASNDTRNLMNSTDLATVFIDRAMRIKLFTPKARAIFNLIPADAGRPLMDITHRLEYPEMAADIERVLETLSVGEREVRSSDERWYIARVLPYRTAEDRISGVVLTFTDITERKRAEEAVRAAREQLEERVAARTRELAEANAALRREMGERQQAEDARVRLLRQLVSAQEEERSRISRELHDQLGQDVTALGVNLAALKTAPELQAATRQKVAALEEVVKRLDSDVEFLVWELRPTGLDDLGLAEALSDYVAGWSRFFNIPVDYDARLPERVGSESETVLYRVAQEALNNIAKHAGAKRVRVTLDSDERQVRLAIDDDGKGFDPARPRDPKSLGLVSIRERAGIVGGTARIESKPGGGTHIRVELPR